LSFTYSIHLDPRRNQHTSFTLRIDDFLRTAITIGHKFNDALPDVPRWCLFRLQLCGCVSSLMLLIWTNRQTMFVFAPFPQLLLLPQQHPSSETSCARSRAQHLPSSQFIVGHPHRFHGDGNHQSTELGSEHCFSPHHDFCPVRSTLRSFAGKSSVRPKDSDILASLVQQCEFVIRANP
jgi:hypothetical protein